MIVRIPLEMAKRDGALLGTDAARTDGQACYG